MDLEEYNRNKFKKYIKPLFIKAYCELCGIDDNLELHHIEQFSELLNEALDILHLEYKSDIKDYTKEELKLIELVLLGLQLKIDYLTLCSICHKKFHKDGGRQLYDYIQFNNKKKLIQNNINNILVPYLESILNQELFENSKELLQNIFIQCNLKSRTMGINSLNKLILEYKIPYIIIAERNKSKRWWIVKSI